MVLWPASMALSAASASTAVASPAGSTVQRARIGITAGNSWRRSARPPAQHAPQRVVAIEEVMLDGRQEMQADDHRQHPAAGNVEFLHEGAKGLVFLDQIRQWKQSQVNDRNAFGIAVHPARQRLR